MDRSWYRIALRGVSRASLARTLVLFGGVLGVFMSTSSPVLAQSFCNQTGGVAATATGGSAFSCGDGATAAGGTAAAFGTDATASGANSTAIGVAATSTGEFSTAIGRASNAAGFASTSVGFNNQATGQDSVIAGVNSKATQEGSIAIGVGTESTAQNGIAIGQTAKASGLSSVALGAGAVATEANTVSLGVAGSERRIVNLAAGTADTDGVNVSQLKQSAADTLTAANQYTDEQADATLVEANTYADTVAGDTLVAANQYTDQQVNQLGSLASAASADLAQFRAQVGDQFAGVNQRLDGMDLALRAMDRRISRQGAMSMAQAHSLATPEAADMSSLGVGIGHSEGENALAIGFRHRVNQVFSFSVGASKSGDENAVGAGANFIW